MSLIEVAILNVLLWPCLHVLASICALKRKPQSFDACNWLYRERRWELKGKFYENVFQVRRWKDRLPDGAALLGFGFQKKYLSQSSDEHLQRFVVETCRGEWAHWVTMFLAPVFCLWNPPWAMAVMGAYAIVANLPCIVVQRYNRFRLQRILQRGTQQERSAKQPAAPSV